MPFQNDILAGASGAGETEYQLWGWGGNGNGQLGQNAPGDGSKAHQATPMELFYGGYDVLEGGYDDDTFGNDYARTSAATTGEGKVACSGTSGYGHTMFIKGDGTLWGCGANNFGQLGQGSIANAVTCPVQVGSETTWTSVSVGREQTAAVREGKLFTFGQNPNGALGDGSTISRSSPVQIGSLTNWKHTSMGSSPDSTGTFAVKTDGTLWSWGMGLFGGLGHGNTISYSSPVQVGTLTNWQQVTGGGNAGGSAIKTDYTLWGWGTNTQGGIGDSSNINRQSPVQVGSDTDWTHVTRGYSNQTGSVKTDGTLWWWGKGTGSPHAGIEHNSPVQVGTLTNWSVCSAAMAGGHAIKQDGTLWGWGLNTANGSGKGSVGDNTTINRTSPVQAGSDTDWIDLAKPQYGGLNQSTQHVIAVKEA